MAKITLICLYDDWAIGLRVLSNALITHGHDVSVIHFKLPSKMQSDRYLDYPHNYEVINSALCENSILINHFHVDINKWTEHEKNLLGEILKEEESDIIGLSVRGVFEDCIVDVFDEIKKVKSAITVAGGMGPTSNPQFFLEHLDYVCLAEGEETIVKMANACDEKEPMTGIDNLAYLKNGVLKVNKITAPENKEDYFYSRETLKIKNHVIENNKFYNDVGPFLKEIDYTMYCGHPNYYTFMGRGCLFTCSYCMAGAHLDLYSKNGQCIRKRRNRKIQDIMDELMWAKNEGCRFVYFNDSFLVGNTKYLTDFFAAYKKNIGLPFFAYLYPEMVFKRRDILDKACEAGLKNTAVGIQSGSPRIHEEVFNRNFSTEKTIRFAELLVDSGLDVGYQILTHNPFESEDDFEQTLNVIARLPKLNAFLQLFRLYAFTGSKISRMMLEQDNPSATPDEYNKRAVLSLIRYRLSDDEQFNEIRRQASKLDFDQMKKMYAKYMAQEFQEA